MIPPNTSGSNFWAGASVDVGVFCIGLYTTFLIPLIQMLNNVTSLAWKPEWQSILANGTVNNVANPPNNLTGIVYGDYFYVKVGPSRHYNIVRH